MQVILDAPVSPDSSAIDLGAGNSRADEVVNLTAPFAITNSFGVAHSDDVQVLPVVPRMDVSRVGQNRIAATLRHSTTRLERFVLVGLDVFEVRFESLVEGRLNIFEQVRLVAF